jgi:hypothetical protein
VEVIVWAAYRPAVGTSFGEAGDELEIVAPDPKPGREQAGLGFRDPAMSLHPYLGYVYTPREDPEAEAAAAVKISEDGFLDPRPLVRHRSGGKLIVGVTGGSVSGQLGSFHARHLERALRRHPSVGDAELEFVWLGMPGYHQPQQLIQLGYLLAQGGELDLLINLDGFNEIAVPAALNAPQGAHPLFPMNWSMVALDVPDPEVRRHLGAIDWLKGERARRAAAFRLSPWSWSPLARLGWKLGDDDLEQRIAEHAWALQEMPVDEVPFFVRGPERMHRPPEELIPELVTVWKRCSLQMDAICSAYGIAYLHCLQPNQYDPGSKPLSVAEKESAFDAEGPYRPVIEAGYPALRVAGAELRASGVAFHDLSDAFAEVAETLYVDNCCHFNGEGNRVLADAIGDALLAAFPDGFSPPATR